jgi:hypothetical protein
MNEPASGRELDGREPHHDQAAPSASVDHARKVKTPQVSTALSVAGTTDVNAEERGLAPLQALDHPGEHGVAPTAGDLQVVPRVEPVPLESQAVHPPGASVVPQISGRFVTMAHGVVKVKLHRGPPFG